MLAVGQVYTCPNIMEVWPVVLLLQQKNKRVELKLGRTEAAAVAVALEINVDVLC